MVPNFAHDCDACILIGKDEKRDFYYCPRCEIDMGGTVICRFSSEGSDYTSSPVSLVQRTLQTGWLDMRTNELIPGSDPRISERWPLSIALRYAKEMGLVK